MRCRGLHSISTCLSRRVLPGRKRCMATPPGPLHGRRIIVTDDNTQELAAVTRILRDAGLCVFAAYDGQSALELITQLPFIDLLITNTRLGVLNGIELMRQTRKIRPDMPILHIIHAGASD